MNAQRTIDPNRIMTAAEIIQVVADLKRKGKRSVSTRQNLIIFRLATFCGLRVSEVCGLKLRDVKTDAQNPCIKVPKAIGKRKKARIVPIMDAGTLADLENWKRERVAQAATADSPFVCSQSVDTFGKPLVTRNAQSRFKAAIKCLGTERISALSIHCGRHSSCSHYLKSLTQQRGDVGQALLEIRNAAGHSDITTTSIYFHTVDNAERQRVDMLAHFQGLKVACPCTFPSSRSRLVRLSFLGGMAVALDSLRKSGVRKIRRKIGRTHAGDSFFTRARGAFPFSCPARTPSPWTTPTPPHAQRSGRSHWCASTHYAESFWKFHLLSFQALLTC